MYCKETYEPKTSYFHEDKENLYSAFHVRMQESHNPNCSSCKNCVCGKNTYVYRQKDFSFNDEWHEQCLTRSYCTDCSGATRNKSRNVFSDSQYCEMPVNTQENFVPVSASSRNSGQRFTKGSMYGCNTINDENVPLCKDSTGPNINHQQARVTSQGKVENIKANETLPGKCCDKIFNQIDPEKVSRTSQNIQTDSDLNDVCKSDERLSFNKSKCSNETKRKSFVNDECKTKLTGHEKVKNNLGKSKTMNAEQENSKGDYRSETFKQNHMSESQQAKRTETQEKLPKHHIPEHGLHRSKATKGSKKMPRRRVQRKSQVHEAKHSHNSENGGIDGLLSHGRIYEFPLFVLIQLRKGVLRALSWVQSCLSVGCSLLVYLFVVIVFLFVFPLISCIWTLTTRCVVYMWNVICSLRNRIFKKQEQTSHDSSGQQPRRADGRQYSEPLPDAHELVSRLLASADLDAYEVIGVSPSATNEEIKRKYRDMAKLVHPDKNAHEDASEAFQVLQSAFEAICDEEKRMAYEFHKNQKRFQEECNDLFETFIQEMLNNIMCSACGKSHPRLPTDRLMFAARYCSQCGVRHPAKEGDIWVETSHLGFKYYCYICTNGQVFEVTEWGACQGLLRVRANSHVVFVSVKPNHSPWEEMFGGGGGGGSDRSNTSGHNKKKRKSKGKPNKNKRH